MIPLPGDPAPDLTLARADDGTPVRLSDLWREKPLLLVFVRHFGCVFCRLEIARLRRLHPTLRERAHVAVVIQSPPGKAREQLTGRYAPPFAVLSDPERLSYRAYGWGALTIWQMLKPRVWARGLAATLAGHLPGKEEGDLRQKSGIVAIGRDGRIAARHDPTDAADFPGDAALVAMVAAAE